MRDEQLALRRQLDDRAATGRELKRLYAALGSPPTETGPAAPSGRQRQLRDRVEQLEARLEKLPSEAVLHGAVTAVEHELGQRARTSARRQEIAPPEHVLAALGPPPDGLAGRAQWRTAAWRIDQARELTGHHDDRQALGDRPNELRARSAWDDAQREISRYREMTSERQRDSAALELG